MRVFMWFLLWMLYSCSSDLPDVPSGVIPPEKMVKILADIHLADAVAETKAAQGASVRAVSEELHEWVYRTHGITRSEFENSLRFYEKTPEWMNKMYEEVQVAISKRQNELQYINSK
ncbi:MAG: DUF4296 domain-containing protein [Chitinophagales bacterium]|nr:DUF4296 domain-containing protein [Chitinophagales bacterium]MDW8419984.1 DUF4296 domain-containing protein [Chitinophagales bacterium]